MIDVGAPRSALEAELPKLSDYIARNPDDYYGYYVRGRAHHELEAYADAEQDLRDVARLAPQFVPGWEWLATVLSARHKYESRLPYSSTEELESRRAALEYLIEDAAGALDQVRALKARGQEGSDLPAISYEQGDEEAAAASAGCLSCHTPMDDPDMHTAIMNVKLGCTDCHGGDATSSKKELAHVAPRDAAFWPSSANPIHGSVLLDDEDPAYIQFINPGDLRVARRACGACHVREVEFVQRSLMTLGPHLQANALYNAGAIESKIPAFGRWVMEKSAPLRTLGVVEFDADHGAVERAPSDQELAAGVVPWLNPIEQMMTDERTAKALRRVSIDFDAPAVIEPHLGYLGANSGPGDYRSSGCSACHVTYANYRDPLIAGPFAQMGNRGLSHSDDQTIPKDQPGHPIRHQFTLRMPSSQCLTCHLQEAAGFVGGFVGAAPWDLEADGGALWPASGMRKGHSVRFMWASADVIGSLWEKNETFREGRFSEAHASGWPHRIVFSTDRHGSYLDAEGSPIHRTDADLFAQADPQMDVHAAAGMYCVDCHFVRDSHGTGKLYADPALAVEIKCSDCHGTIRTRFGGASGERQLTSGPAARGQTDLLEVSTPLGEPRFEWRGPDLRPVQRSLSTGARVTTVRPDVGFAVRVRDRAGAWRVSEQPPVSAPGYSGLSFRPHVAHSTNKGRARSCTDCHVSSGGDNNAWMADLLLQGSDFTDYLGRTCFVAEGESGAEAVQVAEGSELQAVYGSALHRFAFPAEYREHVSAGRALRTAEPLSDVGVRRLQRRGDRLFVAAGNTGLTVYDISEGLFSEVAHLSTSAASAVALPATAPIQFRNDSLPDSFWSENQEVRMHPLYRYAYLADRKEGLVLVDVSDPSTATGELTRALTWNPLGVLDGAENLVVAGNLLLVCASTAVVLIDIEIPLNPALLSIIESEDPKAVAVQFRYAFVLDNAGLRSFNITDPKIPLPAATLSLEGGRGLAIGRTYAYVAAGPKGLAIVDIEHPEHLGAPVYFDADGRINDAQDVVLAMTMAPSFAYVAGGKNGLQVIQLTAAGPGSDYRGFSPRPAPALIATYRTRGPAIALSRGTDRDRAADESGNQVAVFSRIGARPLNAHEMRRLYLRDGKVWTVSDEPPGPPTPIRDD